FFEEDPVRVEAPPRWIAWAPAFIVGPKAKDRPEPVRVLETLAVRLLAPDRSRDLPEVIRVAGAMPAPFDLKEEQVVLDFSSSAPVNDDVGPNGAVGPNFGGLIVSLAVVLDVHVPAIAAGAGGVLDEAVEVHSQP